MSGISRFVTLVEHVPVHLTVFVVHVPSFVIFAVSLRNLFPGAPIHSESSAEVAARSCNCAQAHHFLNEPLALCRHPCLPNEACPQCFAKCMHLAKAALSVSLNSRPSRARTPLGALNGLNRGPGTVREGVSLRFCSLALTGRVRASP